MKKWLFALLMALLPAIAVAHEAETAGVSAESARPAPEVQTIVHAGRLLAVPGKPPLDRQSVLIRGGRIVALRDGFLAPQEAGMPQATVIDLSQHFVLPGLIDAHVHITSTPSRTFLLDRVTQSDAHRAIWGVENARATLMAGFTTIRNAAAFRGDSFDADFALRDGINQGKVIGPRILTAGQGIGSTASQGDFLGYRYEVMDLFAPRSTCSGPYQCREAVRYQIKRGADFIKMVATGWATAPTPGGDQQHMFPDEMQAVVETARLFGRKVTAHATGLDGIKAALRAGVNSIEHGMVLDDEAIKLFKSSGAYLVPTLLVTKRFIAEASAGKTGEEGGRVPGAGNPSAGRAVTSLAEVAERMYESHRRAFQQGVKFAFGTDSAITPHGDNAQEFAMLVERVGMTPMQAIMTATVNGADHIGLEDEVGTLEVGKMADIIAVAGDPLRDVSELERVRFVMRSGVVHKRP